MRAKYLIGSDGKRTKGVEKEPKGRNLSRTESKS